MHKLYIAFISFLRDSCTSENMSSMMHLIDLVFSIGGISHTEKLCYARIIHCFDLNLRLCMNYTLLLLLS